jgi:hypothetical protein
LLDIVDEHDLAHALTLTQQHVAPAGDGAA